MKVTAETITEPTPEKVELIDLRELVLVRGAHKDRSEGMCIMEAVAFFARLPHSDSPACTDPVLSPICQRLNDRWDDAGRQKLVQLIPDLVGTRGSLQLSQRRAFFVVDRVIRSVLPAFLRELQHKPRPDLADQFEGLPPIVDRESAERARDLARKLRGEVWKSLPISDAAAAAADAAAAAADWRALRDRMQDRMVAVVREACALTEAAREARR